MLTWAKKPQWDEIATPAPPRPFAEAAAAESRAIPGYNAAAKLCVLSSVEAVAGTLAYFGVARPRPPVRRPNGTRRRRGKLHSGLGYGNPNSVPLLPEDDVAASQSACSWYCLAYHQNPTYSK